MNYTPGPDEVEAPIGKLHPLSVHLHDGCVDAIQFKAPASRYHRVVGEIDTDVALRPRCDELCVGPHPNTDLEYIHRLQGPEINKVFKRQVLPRHEGPYVGQKA